MDRLSKYSVEQEDVMGLDITSKAVRVAQLSKEKNKWILEKLSYKYVDIPTGLSDTKKVENYINYIKEAIASAKITTINAAVSLPVSSSIIKMTKDEQNREKMAKAARNICDGKGALRVTRKISLLTRQ